MFKRPARSRISRIIRTATVLLVVLLDDLAEMSLNFGNSNIHTEDKRLNKFFTHFAKSSERDK